MRNLRSVAPYRGLRRILGAILSPGLTPWAIIGGPSGAKKTQSEFPDPLAQSSAVVHKNESKNGGTA
jgi:hypothetical protein